MDPHFLEDQLTLFQPGWADYAQHITIGPHIFGPYAASALICTQWENFTH